MNTANTFRSAMVLLALFGAFSVVAAETFFDDFTEPALDSGRWYAARKNWDYSARGFSGGVVPANLSVSGGVLDCIAHGNLYSGGVYGVAYGSTSLKKDGKCTGACIVTREYHASGSYEIRARVAPVPGVCCAMWTAEEEVEEYYEGEVLKKRELVDGIEFQLPGRPSEAVSGIGYGYALCNSMSGRKGDKYATAKSYVGLPQAQDDGGYHTYRFDWHTGGTDHGTNIVPRVEFYVDGVLVQTNVSHVPVKAGRLWVGAWFPKDWAGSPDFDTSAFQIDYVKITPFDEPNDVEARETDPTDRLVDPGYVEETGGTDSGDGKTGDEYVVPEPFFDDFSSGSLDPDKWFAAQKNWGGKIRDADGNPTSEDYNGGVMPQNVYVRDGKLQCEAHGNGYLGDLLGLNKDLSWRADGKRVGGCAVTKEYFASGRYEIRAKVAPSKGVCCTMWTFEYEEVGQKDVPEGQVWNPEKGYYVINHEIDIEMPGRPLPAHENIGYDYALCNTWIGEEEGEYTASHMPLPAPQDDGEFHTYRFDWHTGGTVDGTNIVPRVEFYFDGVPVVTNYTHIPYKAGRLWVGAWSPNGWAGTPDFDTDVFEVDWVSIIPFGEPNDRPQKESYGSDGMVKPLNVFPPEKWEVGTPEAASVTAYLTEKGKLVFGGSGTVQSFAKPEDAPWASALATIGSVAYPASVRVDVDALKLPNLVTVNGKPYAPKVAPAAAVFEDRFDGAMLDTNRWFAANKNWGGKVEKWSSEDYNGGVVPQNLFVKDGMLRCVAHGNDYEGDIIGIAKPGGNKIAMPRADGKRVGACAVTKDYYASGSYEIRARVAPSSGVCCTMWTFEYEELYPGDEGFPADCKDDYYVVNHEIDIEMPGRPGSKHENISYEYALCNTWVGEKGSEYTTGYTKLDRRQDDGQFHTYRFDWHTGGVDPVTGTNIEKRVEFYFDGRLTRTNTTHIPTKAGRLWIGAWFPNGWAGTPSFDTDVFEIDYVKITPFNEPGDEPAHETYGRDGLAEAYNMDTRSVWDVGAPVASSVKAHINGNNELVFTGSGAVKSFATVQDAPWGVYAELITGAKVADGVTFGKGAQTGLTNLACIGGIPTALWNGDTTEEAWGVFYDDFTSGIVDPDKWYAANKNWGGDIELDGFGGQNYNGGVVADNLYVKDDKLQCEAHGSLYEGDVIGITKGGDRRPDGKRVGACAVTKDYFASGRYEIRAKVAPAKGVCCTMWTFEYEEIYDHNDPQFKGSGAYSVVNHEIDIEMPGRPQDDGKFENVGYDYALCNTWIGEKGDEYTASHMKLPKRQDDGEFHTYRFDWHAGNESGTIRPRVEFYFDGVLVQINYSFIPFKAGRFWVGAWFPRGWAGTPNFDTSVFEVDWVKITPYFEENDRPQNESYGDVENMPQSWTGLVRPYNVAPAPFWEVGSPVASDVIARLGTNGVLSLSGVGAVKEFASAAEAPWADFAKDIKGVVVHDSWETGGPLYLYSKDWVQHWGYRHLDGDMTLTEGSLAGLDNLETLNGTPLTTFSQVLTSLGGVVPMPLRVDFAVIRVDSAENQAEMDLSVLRSSDGVNWTPVDAMVQKGSDGTSLEVSASAASGK